MTDDERQIQAETCDAVRQLADDSITKAAAFAASGSPENLWPGAWVAHVQPACRFSPPSPPVANPKMSTSPAQGPTYVVSEFLFF